MRLIHTQVASDMRAPRGQSDHKRGRCELREQSGQAKMLLGCKHPRGRCRSGSGMDRLEQAVTWLTVPLDEESALETRLSSTAPTLARGKGRRQATDASLTCYCHQPIDLPTKAKPIKPFLAFEFIPILGPEDTGLSNGQCNPAAQEKASSTLHRTKWAFNKCCRHYYYDSPHAPFHPYISQQDSHCSSLEKESGTERFNNLSAKRHFAYRYSKQASK
ncbi:uncharacterized protein LOC119941870 [Tachyglossus aculeatus]|uniref:uncharacterized protein LOC119941870 n=1 Tax=Tachyglossus aculeatus TaxID=9261 RepID=UPI0018F55442|nr:uncharacterized protein LOC119941870 [Tachyglossus aculeatus]